MKQEKQRFLQKAIIETKNILHNLIEQECRAYNMYYDYKKQIADLKQLPAVAKYNDITIKYVGACNVLNMKNSLLISEEVAKEMAQKQLVYKTQLSRMHSDENIKKYISALSGQKEMKRLCMFLTEERYRYEKFLEKAQKKLKRMTKNKTLGMWLTEKENGIFCSIGKNNL